MQLTEGGNIFKDENGRALTQRINQTDVKPTIAWLDLMLPDLNLADNTLGSTGIKATSGDLDLAVDANQVSKEQLIDQLTHWLKSQGVPDQDLKKWVQKSGTAVHFRTPIDGRPQNGFVQTDFMFLKKPAWSKFVLGAMPADSNYKGKERNVLMNSIAKSMGYKLNQIDGIADRATNQMITDDPNQVAKLLLNPRATALDLASVETIYNALARDPKREQKLADFREHLARENLPEPGQIAETVETTEVSFLSRLRDRIVNQGMYALIEGQQLLEAEARIAHLEDLVFKKGTRGAEEALAIITHAGEDTKGTTTVKWDGKPAIIWGRKPTGEFVLTDKSGFGAKGYDGLATSPQQLEKIMRMRSGERGELIDIYNKLWPMLEAATPKGFSGYMQGDLLYTNTPPEIAGAYEFQPNYVKYRIPVQSKLGQAIGSSEVGIAAHTFYSEANSAPQPIKHITLKKVPGLLVIEPTVNDIENVRPNAKLVKQLKQVLRNSGAAIDSLFNPADLRASQISDLPALCERYINSRIHDDYSNLLADFGPWLQRTVTPRKYNNIAEYLTSPRANQVGMAAAFKVFLLLHEIKTDMLEQLDRQQPGQEGWVLATPAGRAKLVNRFGFSAGNRILNNPNLAS